MEYDGHRRWQEIYIKRALMLLPIGYIMKKLHEYKKPISPSMQRLISYRLRQPEPRG